MKRLYRNLLCLMALSAVAFSARASVTIHVTVDRPELVSLQIAYETQEINPGKNTYVCDDWSQVYFNINGQAYFKSVKENGEEKLSQPTQYYSIYGLNSEYDGHEFELTTITYDEMCTGSFSFTIDDPARLSNMTVGGTPYLNYSGKDFEPGQEATVKFNPDHFTGISLNANGAPFYKVTKNGEEVTPGQYGVEVTPAQGDKIEVTATYPDVIAKVKFDHKNDGDKIIDKVYIYGDASTGYSKTYVDFTAEGFEVPLGSQVVLQHVKTYKDYSYASYKVNDQEFTGNAESQQFYITNENTTIAIDATLMPAIDFTLDIDHPEGVVVNCGKYGGYVVQGLTAGSNPVTFHEGNNELNVRKLGGYKITSLTVNGNPVEVDWDGKSYSTYVSAGDKVVVTTEALPTYKFYITVDDPARVELKRYYNTSLPVETLPLKAGRNEFDLSDEDDEARTLHVFPAEGCYISTVSLNGEDLERDSWSGYFKILTGADYEATVSSEVIDRNQRYAIYIDDLKAPELSSTNWASSNGTKTIQNLKNGYNVYDFFHGDNYFKFSAYYNYGKDCTCAYYLNGEKMEYEGYGYNAETKFMLQDGDVVRVYLATATPESYTVKFAAPEDNKVAYVNVTRDIIVPVENYTEEATVLQGTRYTFTIEADSKVIPTVTANDEALTPDENGLYTVDVNANTEVKLTYEVKPNAVLYLVGDFNDWATTSTFASEDGVEYEISVASLPGQFKITDGDKGEYTFGGDGTPLVLNSTVTLVKDSETALALADQGATEVKLHFNLETAALTVDGTSGINSAIIAEDSAADATYYTLQGIRVNGRPAPGIYIRVSAGVATKVAVK